MSDTQVRPERQRRDVDEAPVLVCIPTYNESQNLPLVVSRLRAAVPRAHVLVADDNSPDGTGDIADELAASDDHVHVLHRAGKQGLAAAYVAAFGWGLDNGYRILVEMDADGSHRPEELPRLLDGLRGADMVKGSRWVPGGEVINWPKSRLYLSKAGNLYTRIMLGLPVRDVTGGYNAFWDDTLRAIDLANIASAGYFFQTDMTIHTINAGLEVVEVPITFEERQYGESKLDSSIFVESLRRTTTIGLGRLLGAVRGVIGAGRAKR